MSVNFDALLTPEPSSLVGFSQNTLIRDAENRTEETLQNAIENPNARFYAVAKGKVILEKFEEVKVQFSKHELEKFDPRMDRTILLGEAENGPRLAVPCGVDPDALEEPLRAYDLRSLLYSSSVGQSDVGAIAQACSMLYWHSINRHCGRCGTASQSMIGGYRRDCPNCGLKIFPRTDPVVIMLPVQGERCIMGRSPHFPQGWYSTLAGFVEPGETIEDAVRRETNEESGVTVGRVLYHASQPWPFPHSLMIGMYCEVLSSKISFDSKELEDCRWFTRDEVRQMIVEEHPDGFICPPNKAISSALIRHWAGV